ncbi:hypothetical protein GPA27_28805 [Aromatoleum toluolicum]|nr:hypothetical protein [Aromatoleum toluolicum]MCQ6963975.1 hypothetical protein [Aromatoleum toluolicum]
METPLSHAPTGFDLLQSGHLEETRQLVAGVFCDHRLDLVRPGRSLAYRHQHAHIGRVGFSLMSYGAEV